MGGSKAPAVRGPARVQLSRTDVNARLHFGTAWVTVTTVSMQEADRDVGPGLSRNRSGHSAVLDGDELVINGVKRRCSGAGHAEQLPRLRPASPMPLSYCPTEIPLGMGGSAIKRGLESC